MGLIGIALGSFTNVLVSRIPRARGVMNGRSACPRCGHQISWSDNIPVLSWLLLRGRCRHCHEPIAWVYPVVEVAVAALCLVAYGMWGFSATTVLFMFLAVVSVALTAIDVEHHRLPHRLVLPSYGIAAGIMVVAWIAGERQSWWSALVGLGALGGFYGVMWFVYPKGMGFGDVTTAGLLGMVAGFLGLPTLAVGALMGPLLGGLMVLVLAVSVGVKKGTPVPFGPALIAGAWVGYVWGDPLWRAYLGLSGVS